MTTDRVKEILSWYKSESPAIQGNLYRIMMTGRLAGTGKFVILPVDQGFEHGPARTFAPNPSGYDPRYHFELALESGCNAYAAPKGQMEATIDEFAAVFRPFSSSITPTLCSPTKTRLPPSRHR